jgi:hypothetical protein
MHVTAVKIVICLSFQFFVIFFFFKNDYFVLLGQNASRMSGTTLPILMLRFWGNPPRLTSPLLTSPVSETPTKILGDDSVPESLQLMFLIALCDKYYI